MAVGAADVYSPFLELLGNAGANLDTHVFKALLLDSGHTPDLDNHNQLSDITADEMSGNGYARQTLSGVSWVRSGGTVKFTAGASISFQAAGGDLVGIKYLVVYDDSDADDIPVFISDLNSGGGAIADVTDGTSLILTVPAGGFFDLAMA